MASTLTLKDGRRIFAKGASDSTTDVAVELYRRERDVLTWLPGSVPHARLMRTHESGGWIVLLYDYVAGRHPVPARPAISTPCSTPSTPWPPCLTRVR
jgi:hypothetical protein